MAEKTLRESVRLDPASENSWYFMSSASCAWQKFDVSFSQVLSGQSSGGDGRAREGVRLHGHGASSSNNEPSRAVQRRAHLL